jgi:hypothetical protein
MLKRQRPPNVSEALARGRYFGLSEVSLVSLAGDQARRPEHQTNAHTQRSVPTPVTRVIRVQFLLEQTHVRATSYDCTSRSDLEKRMLLITSTECRTIAEKKLLEASRDTTTAGVSQRCRGLAFSRWSTEGPRKSLDLMVVEKTPTLGPGPDDPTEEVGLPAPRDRQACRPRRPRKCQQARCISGRGRRLVARMKKPAGERG